MLVIKEDVYLWKLMTCCGENDILNGLCLSVIDCSVDVVVTSLFEPFFYTEDL